ncbi:hypothetical protein ADUPG1_009892 [Aduncisulcus paluster]|uniref:Uncharacterized protein n=1 Tax=Aduncisulcus paluster TaxID=2918883 RepID=A0ABQ5L117_9EUKA|nr:hypothetical protein ADUPG1_009892 [Aduncisulcus paluster]
MSREVLLTERPNHKADGGRVSIIDRSKPSAATLLGAAGLSRDTLGDIGKVISSEPKFYSRVSGTFGDSQHMLPTSYSAAREQALETLALKKREQQRTSAFAAHKSYLATLTKSLKQAKEQQDASISETIKKHEKADQKAKTMRKTIQSRGGSDLPSQSHPSTGKKISRRRKRPAWSITEEQHKSSIQQREEEEVESLLSFAAQLTEEEEILQDDEVVSALVKVMEVIDKKKREKEGEHEDIGPIDKEQETHEQDEKVVDSNDQLEQEETEKSPTPGDIELLRSRHHSMILARLQKCVEEGLWEDIGESVKDDEGEGVVTDEGGIHIVEHGKHARGLGGVEMDAETMAKTRNRVLPRLQKCVEEGLWEDIGESVKDDEGEGVVTDEGGIHIVEHGKHARGLGGVAMDAETMAKTRNRVLRNFIRKRREMRRKHPETKPHLYRESIV